MRTPRQFEAVDPTMIQCPNPFAIGLYGYTGTGKTESAFRLATGIQRVYGGDIFFADTDGGRGLHYRNTFPHRYIDFRPPHNALDFADLLSSHIGKRGVLIIDQMTEEHEGEGGLIDTHEEKKGGNDKKTASAWAFAKAQHKILARTLRAAVASLPVIICWRAQEKLDWNHKNDRGQTEPKALGEMPIGSMDLPFEMTATYLLPIGSRGTPCLDPMERGEKLMTKIPRQFADIVRKGETFTADHGEAMARWAMGSAASAAYSELRAAIDRATSGPDLDALAPALKDASKRKTVTPAEWRQLTEAGSARRAALAQRPPSHPPAGVSPGTRQPGEDA